METASGPMRVAFTALTGLDDTARVMGERTADIDNRFELRRALRELVPMLKGRPNAVVLVSHQRVAITDEAGTPL